MEKKQIGPELFEDLIKRIKDGEECILKGRIINKRKHAKVTFLDIADHTDKLQIVIKKDSIDNENEILELQIGSFIEIKGNFKKTDENNEIIANKIKIISKVELPISPTPWEIDGNDPSSTEHLFNYTEFYLSNPQRAAILKIKTTFVESLHSYFRNMI